MSCTGRCGSARWVGEPLHPPKNDSATSTACGSDSGKHNVQRELHRTDKRRAMGGKRMKYPSHTCNVVRRHVCTRSVKITPQTMTHVLLSNSFTSLPKPNIAPRQKLFDFFKLKKHTQGVNRNNLSKFKQPYPLSPNSKRIAAPIISKTHAHTHTCFSRSALIAASLPIAFPFAGVLPPPGPPPQPAPPAAAAPEEAPTPQAAAAAAAAAQPAAAGASAEQPQLEQVAALLARVPSASIPQIPVPAEERKQAQHEARPRARTKELSE